MTNNIMVFDIETIPDVETGRKLYNLSTKLSDTDVAAAMYAKNRQKSGGSEFLPHYLHRVVAISIVLKNHSQIKVWSLGEEDSDEKELITRFFAGVDRFAPTLVSWNGGGFDLPVLHYRALQTKVVAPSYWETGDREQNFRWNNYLSRYHWRHTDIMDVLAGYQARAVAPLDAIATMLGFPGKMGMSGAKVWDAFCNGKIKEIRDYCETDVLNTYLVYLRFQLMIGKLEQSAFDAECQLLRQYLSGTNQPHFHSFLQFWEQSECA